MATSKQTANPMEFVDWKPTEIGDEKPTEFEDENHVTEVRMKRGGALIIKRTPERPETHTTTFVIAEIEAEIAKIDGVIELWQAKKAPLQAIMDEYVEMA